MGRVYLTDRVIDMQITDQGWVIIGDKSYAPADVYRILVSNAGLLDAAKDALCELDPDCKYDGSNYKGEPSDKGNSRIQTILALYRIIEQAEEVK